MEKEAIKKQVYQYSAIFEPDEEAGGYSVSIPDLPGCISEGDTFEEALKNIKEAALLYIETAIDRKQEELFKKESKAIIAPVDVVIS